MTDGNNVWFASEYIGQTCTLAQYLTAPIGSCGGTRTSLANWGTRISKVTPSFVYNTVDNPWTPRAGQRHTLSVMFAGGPLGGTVGYWRPSVESIVYLPVGRKMSLGTRAQVAYIQPFGDTKVLPWYQRYFLGGETQIRGYNVRLGQRTRRARIQTPAAADALRMRTGINLICGQKENRGSSLGHRHIKIRNCESHHRSAHHHQRAQFIQIGRNLVAAIKVPHFCWDSEIAKDAHRPQPCSCRL